jgi:hypothetical protein
MSALKFQSSDTWILVALLRATEPGTRATLSELIRAGDSVNHAVLTRDELEAGFNRLVAAGHASASPAGYAPSEAIREFWEKQTKSWGSLYKSWQQLGNHIGAETKSIDGLPNTDTEQYVSKVAYQAAVAGYSLNVPHPLLGKQ